MYESPINIIQNQVQMEYENGIVRAIQSYDVVCDKKELIKALQYDRDQYTKGYNDRDKEIVRCRDCKHSIKDKTFGDLWCNQGRQSNCVSGDDYCSRGERREDATEENDKG